MVESGTLAGSIISAESEIPAEKGNPAEKRNLAEKRNPKERVSSAEGRIPAGSREHKKNTQDVLQGIFTAHPRGFGFVTVEGFDEDLFVPPDNVRDALDGDTVEVRASGQRGRLRAEALVLKVIKRANRTVVGLYEKNRSSGFVIPDNPRITRDIHIPAGEDAGAVTGHKVVVELTDFGGPRRNPEGRIIEILGHKNDPGVDIESIVRAYDLPQGFPQQVMDEAARAPEELSETEIAHELERGRLDLRGVMMVTIDGEDAKDLDDAVSASKETINGRTVYHLGVHIADVTHYVKEGGALDREALKRGTSIYLVDRVIPMLPHRLSNGICSLNAGCDRLALSCLMDVDEKGNVTGHEIRETLIRVDRRMTYTAVDAILEANNRTAENGGAPESNIQTAESTDTQGPSLRISENAGTQAPDDRTTDVNTRVQESAALEEYADLIPLFLLMNEAAHVLRGKRFARGAVDFDFPECKITLDAKGRPTDIRPYERSEATMLIEDFMLAANETVAEDYFWQQLPFLYRTHEKPDPEKIRAFGILINNFGYSLHLQNGELHPKEMQKLLERVSGTPEEALLSRLALRSMKQAKYTVECSGHFGLAANYYTHFTSPIRRYPDLQIHRIIKENLRGGLNERHIAHYEGILGEVAVSSSARERLADEAERETDKVKKIQYMESRIGETFDGIISGVNNHGFYVELPNTVEGMIRLSDLTDDYYIFDDRRYELVGERTGRTYKLGQSIRVMLAATDRHMRTIDFLPEQERSDIKVRTGHGKGQH